jgi:hypothetical protein
MPPKAPKQKCDQCMFRVQASIELCTSKCGGREEERHPEAAFAADIPLGNVVIDAGEQATFEDTKENASRHETRVVMHKALEDHC